MKTKFSYIFIFLFFLSSMCFSQFIRSKRNSQLNDENKVKIKNAVSESANRILSLDTFFVPTDYPQIQEAVNAADSGDVVIIEEGSYYQQFSFEGKAITVGSRFVLDQDTSHISKTIIDGSFLPNPDSASLVYFVTGENSNSELCGLTLQNGHGTLETWDGGGGTGGGAIWLSSSGGTIKNNIIRYNNLLSSTESLYQVYGFGIESTYLPADKSLLIKENLIHSNKGSGDVATGGGVDVSWADGSVLINKNRLLNNYVAAKRGGYGSGICIYECASEDIRIMNNFISGNHAEAGWGRGAGIAVENAKAEILNNLITENNCSKLSGTDGDARGGGISVRYYPGEDAVPVMKGIITNNTIVWNYAENQGGGIYARQIDVEIINNIIYKNEAPAQIYFELGAGFTQIVEYSNIEGGFSGTGNIDVDPMFCDTTYCLLTEASSECIDAGNPDLMYNDVLDGFNVLYPAYGSQRNDMGAFGGAYSKWWEKDMQFWDTTTTAVENEVVVIPNKYKLSQNYPNPFNPSTVIEYDIPEECFVTMKIFDILGGEVKTLVNEEQKSGAYKLTFNANELTSGVYFYKILAGDFVDTKKMMVLK